MRAATLDDVLEERAYMLGLRSAASRGIATAQQILPHLRHWSEWNIEYARSLIIEARLLREETRRLLESGPEVADETATVRPNDRADI